MSGRDGVSVGEGAGVFEVLVGASVGVGGEAGEFVVAAWDTVVGG
jgi:hypothetical protein